MRCSGGLLLSMQSKSQDSPAGLPSLAGHVLWTSLNTSKVNIILSFSFFLMFPNCYFFFSPTRIHEAEIIMIRFGTIGTCAKSPRFARSVNSVMPSWVRYWRPEMLMVFSHPFLRPRQAVQVVTPICCSQTARLTTAGKIAFSEIEFAFTAYSKCVPVNCERLGQTA